MKTMLFALIAALSLATVATGQYQPYPYWGSREYPRYIERDGGDITVIVITGDSRPSDWQYGIPYGDRTMGELWDVMYDQDARFTVRAGDEYLVYGEHALYYSSGDARSNVMVYPEELWYIVNHCFRPFFTPATGEVSMEAWFPGMDEPLRSFLTANDPAMSVVQVLLQRGREAAL